MAWPRDAVPVSTRILPGLAALAVTLAATALLGGEGGTRGPVRRRAALEPGPRSSSPTRLPAITPALPTAASPALSRALSPAPPPPVVGEDLPESSLPFLSEVVTESGDPVPGALVLLGDLDAPSWAAPAAGDGRFVLAASPINHTLRAGARRDGEAWIGSTPADGGPFPWTVVVRPPASCHDRVVVVRVLDPEGRPVPRATAVPLSGAVRGKHPRTEGGAVSGGVFVVPAARWHRGEVPVFLLRDPRDGEDRPLPLGEAAVAVDPAGPAEVEVRLPAGGFVGGRLLGPDGRPRVGGTVTFRQEPPGTLPVPSPEWTCTDREGRFLFASGPGGGLLEATDLLGSGPVAAAAGEVEVVLRLREEAPLLLLVLDEGGAPVEEGSVWVEVVGGESSRKRVALAADGTGTLPGLPAGCEIDLSVWVSGCMRHEGRTRVDGSLLRIELRRAAVVRGRLVAADGTGIPGATVLASAPGDLPVPWATWALTGDDGSFSIQELPPGAAVRLAAGDERRTLVEEEVVAGGGEEVLLRLPAEEEVLLVYVDGGDCRPESAPVVISAGGRVLARGFAWWLPAFVAIPASDLPPTVDVAVGPTSWYGERAFLRGVPSRGILRPDMGYASVRGRVLRADGSGAAFARCRAEGEGGLSVEFEADERGEFRSCGLLPGPVVVTAEGFDGSTGTAAAEAPAEEVEVVLEGR